MKYQVKILKGQSSIELEGAVAARSLKQARRIVCKKIGCRQIDKSQIEVVRIKENDLVKVPVLNIPMMSDERWEQLCHESAVKKLRECGYIDPTQEQIDAYHAELKNFTDVLAAGKKPDLKNKSLYPVLSIVMGEEEEIAHAI